MSKLNYSYIGIGTNLGDRLKNIQLAYKLIQSNIGEIRKKSDIYKTPPWGFESKNEFYNCVVKVSTKLNADQLLDEIKTIEKTLGREGSFKIGYSSRVIDLDIIDFNGELINSKSLSIPHPHLENRNFVLFPLADVSSKWIHPKTEKSINELIGQLDTKDEISKVII